MPRSPSPARSRSRGRSYSKSPSPSRSKSPIKRGRSGSPGTDAPISPFLVRIFVTKGKHTPLVEFDEGNFPLRDEFQVYAWKSSTPTSLIRLLSASFPAPYRSPLARYAFRHVYVDASSRGLYRSKDLTSFSGRDVFSSADADMDVDERPSGRRVDERSLDEYGFVTGDFISVSLHVPEPKLPAGPPGLKGREREVSGAGPGPGSGLGPRGGAGGPQPFGWGDRDRPAHAPARGVRNEDEVKGHWVRGQPLPPQEFAGGRGGRGGHRDVPGAGLGGGGWRDGPSGPGGPGSGIRGQGQGRGGAARRSPEYERRSRSPEARERRESWSRRK